MLQQFFGGKAGGFDITGILKMAGAFIPSSEPALKAAVKGCHEELSTGTPFSFTLIARHFLPLLKDEQLQELRALLLAKIAAMQTKLGRKLVLMAELTDDGLDAIIVIYLRDEERKLEEFTRFNLNNVKVEHIKKLINGSNL